MRRGGWIVLMLVSGLMMDAALAREAQPLAEDPVLERRINALGEDLRCLVCQNQSLADSHADFAIDVKNEMRLQMQQGRSDQEVVDFLVARYGDFILFKPPVKAVTMLLWFGPFILLAVGAAVLIVTLRRRRQRSEQTPLSEAEQRRAAALLGDTLDGEQNR
ncbi:MAG: cytochrome c-type biogenesis protein CcmH [Gammaproteobacteria bacterium]|nr:cytochrome c-type biogenesis protein CcmH [Gammaproteobacteria bacterium]